MKLNLQSNDKATEYDLLQGCIDGDRNSQKLLYDRFAATMYGICLRYSDNDEDARDLLQEGFIKAFKNLAKFRKEGSFEGWLRRIFVNTSIEFFRKKAKFNAVRDIDEVNVEDKGTGILDTLAEKDIMAMIQKLSPGYRTVFNLYVIEGYSHQEISTILGISDGTSKSQLARAKTVLRKMAETRLGISTHSQSI